MKYLLQALHLLLNPTVVSTAYAEEVKFHHNLLVLWHRSVRWLVPGLCQAMVSSLLTVARTNKHSRDTFKLKNFWVYRNKSLLYNAFNRSVFLDTGGKKFLKKSVWTAYTDMWRHMQGGTDEPEVKSHHDAKLLYCHPKTAFEPSELVSWSLEQRAQKLNPFDFCIALLALTCLCRLMHAPINFPTVSCC